MKTCLMWELTVGELSNLKKEEEDKGRKRRKKRRRRKWGGEEKEKEEENRKGERTFHEEKTEFAKSYDSMNLYLIV